MLQNPRRSRARTAFGSILTTALVCGGLTVQVLPAQAADLVPVPKSEYSIAAVSSESDPWPAPPSLDGTAAGAIDDDFNTQWTSRYANNAPFPHYLVVDLQRDISVKAIDYSVKKGQGVAAKDAKVFVTNDAAVAKTQPGEAGWGAAVAAATLNAPTANDQKQRIELSTAKTARYVAFVIESAQAGADATGGGVGEIEILSDAQLPPIVSEPEGPGDPETPEVETFSIGQGGTRALVNQSFPQITGYSVGAEEGGRPFAGQTGAASKWVVNGTPYTASTTATPSATGVDYVSVLDGIDVTVYSSISVTEAGTVVFEVTDVEGTVEVTTLGLSDNVFVSATAGGAGATLDRTIVDPNSTRNADEHLALSPTTPVGKKGAAYAFLSNGSLVASVLTNATTQPSEGNASWNTRLLTSVTDTDGRTATIGSNEWLIHPAGATDDRVTTFELPSVTVAFAEDENGDGEVNWQDGAIRYRAVDEERLGGERVAERVVSRIPFNFASSATNYFDLVLDNTKRIANSTDGLGQWVLNKGYGSEGHDSANTDYGGNYNERAGGVEDLNHLVNEGKKLNADMSVHVNATEIYPQADSFEDDILDGAAPFKPGWNWLDQSYYINQQADLGSGKVLDRFQQLRDEVPGLSGVYIDVYYSNGWVAEGLAKQLRGMDLEVATEWGDKFVDNAVWAHWPNDLAYGGKENKGINSTMVRFIQNGQADIWNDDALLGQQRLVDAEGWVGNRNWDGFMANVWKQSLPTKFIQHFDLQSYEAAKRATLTGDVEITLDGQTRVITLGGQEVLRGDAYLLPWQSVESSDETGSPLRADKMYFYSETGGEKTFGLTAAFSGNTAFDVFELGDQGRTKVTTAHASGGKLTIEGKAGQAYVVVPQDGAKRAAVVYHDAGLADPGFNSGSLDVWNPKGDVTLARTAEGDAKTQSSGDNITQFGKSASSIEQNVTGLTPGERYTFSAQVQIAHTATRDVTLSVSTSDTTAQRSWNLSPTYNYMRADSKTGQYYQRGSVAFTAPESGEVTVKIAADKGTATVSIDNARIMRDSTTPEVSETEGLVYANDFEGNQPGWGPFVKGDANGIDDPRTSVSRRHDPYTSADWRNTAKPFAPGGAMAGLAVDTTLNGEHSLMSHAENGGLVYRTDPTTVPLEAGHSYRIGFNYQVGQTGAYRWVQGVDTLVDGKVKSTTRSTQELPQALETTGFSQDISVGCGDNTWVGLERIPGTDVDFVLDDFTVVDLGETAGGTACAGLKVDGGSLSPGASNSIETTFTNTENEAVENVGIEIKLPEGYSVQLAKDSKNVFKRVPAGESVTTTWLVTAPADAAGASVSIGVSATYRSDCDVRTVKIDSPARVAQKARIPNSLISIAGVSSEEDSAGAKEGPAKLMLDGDPGTIWHTRYSSDATSYPHHVTFDLGSETEIEGVGYLRRAANNNGPIKGYKVEVSADNETFTEVATGEWKNIAEWQDVSFEPTSARFVKVTALSSISGTQFAAVAEMAIYGVTDALEGDTPQTRPEDNLSGCESGGGSASAKGEGDTDDAGANTSTSAHADAAADAEGAAAGGTDSKGADANGTDANGTDANGTDANGTDANGTTSTGLATTGANGAGVVTGIAGVLVALGAGTWLVRRRNKIGESRRSQV